MRIEMVWLVVAVAGACGEKKDRHDVNADGECDRLPTEEYRQDCKREYNRRGKTTEVSLKLNKIGKAAKTMRAEIGSYPKEPGSLLPHQTGTCCGDSGGTTQINNKCTPNPAAFKDDAGWSHLEFSVDEPSIYSYQYVPSVDGSDFTAYAVGDADCDGKLATFTLVGTVTSKGNAATTIVPPSIGVY